MKDSEKGGGRYGRRGNERVRQASKEHKNIRTKESTRGQSAYTI